MSPMIPSVGLINTQMSLYTSRENTQTAFVCFLLQDLLSQVGHYSERVRKDALSGLSKLLSQHPEVLRSQASPLYCCMYSPTPPLNLFAVKYWARQPAQSGFPLLALSSMAGHFLHSEQMNPMTPCTQHLQHSTRPATPLLQAGTIVEKLAEHAADTDEGVRAAVRDLLREVVLPGLGAAGLAPFLPLLMAHITSAMTHLAAAVR